MRDAPSCGTVDGMRRGGDRAGSNLAGQPWSNWPSLDQVDDGLESGRPPAVTPSAAPDPAPAVTTGPAPPPPPPRPRAGPGPSRDDRPALPPANPAAVPAANPAT